MLPPTKFSGLLEYSSPPTNYTGGDTQTHTVESETFRLHTSEVVRDNIIENV
uniref:Uncharacterized protein n=1 Tax=Arion vulgaris TaxID=1028688 RepID=A0A0B6Y7S5_9EUPU